jgi:hypothetical protein
LLVARGLIDGTSIDHIAGVNYDFKGVAVLVDSDSEDEGMQGDAPPGHAEAAISGGEAAASGSPASQKSAVTTLPEEPPSVAELLKAVAKPPFNLAAAGSGEAASSADPGKIEAPPAALPPSGSSSSAPAAEVTSSAGAATVVAKRCGKGLVDPTDWNSRHAALLEKMPKEALPPDVPHGDVLAKTVPYPPKRACRSDDTLCHRKVS